MNSVIDRLVLCAKTKAFEDALQILFVNSQKIPKLMAGFWQYNYFLIHVSGDSLDRRRSMETGIRQWKEVLEVHRNISTEKIDQEEIKEKAKELMDSFFGKSDLTFEELSSYPWLQPPIQKKGIVSIIMKKSLIEYERESVLLKKLMKEKNFIDLLSDSDLSLIEPWSQIGICHVCKTFEHISATQGSRPPICPKCNQPNLTAMIYGFDKEFQKHLISNKALPIFCAAYINDLLKKTVAKPLKLKDEERKDQGDIDVYIESTNTGIECKLSLEHDPSESQFQNHFKEILNDLKIYINYGVKNLIVITNIEEHRAETLKKKLEDEMKLDSEISFKMVYRSVPLLLDILSREAEKIKNL